MGSLVFPLSERKVFLCHEEEGKVGNRGGLIKISHFVYVRMIFRGVPTPQGRGAIDQEKGGRHSASKEKFPPRRGDGNRGRGRDKRFLGGALVGEKAIRPLEGEVCRKKKRSFVESWGERAPSFGGEGEKDRTEKKRAEDLPIGKRTWPKGSRGNWNCPVGRELKKNKENRLPAVRGTALKKDNWEGGEKTSHVRQKFRFSKRGGRSFFSLNRREKKAIRHGGDSCSERSQGRTFSKRIY